jgi:deoxyadenosine/deoxycytidine kinase
LISLNKLYEGFTKQYQHGKLIEIDVNNLDFVSKADDFKSIVEKIDRTINLGTQLKI